MTHKTRLRKFRRAEDPPKRPTAGQVVFCLMSTFCFILVLKNTDAAIEYMGRGLSLCARTVIPSLFPFMVLSELLVSSGAGEAFGRLFARIMRALFGLSGAGVSAVVLGSFCGFPIGARTAVALLDRNAISKSECEHLLTFTSNPSSAFLISAVGVSLYGNRNLGMILYGIVLGSGFFIGFLARFLIRRSDEPIERPHFPSGLHIGGVETFTKSVSGAATGMLLVCAYVIFFSALTGALGCALRGQGRFGEISYALLCGVLEMTGGISEASALGEPWGLILTAAFAGWSGISVHCQIMTLCAGRGISFRPYLIAKALQGLLCGVMMGGVLIFMPDLITPAEGVVTDAIAVFSSWKEITVPAMISYTVLIIGWLIARLDHRQKDS